MQIIGLDLMLNADGHTAQCLRKNNVRLYLYGPNYKTRHADVYELIKQGAINDLMELNDAITGERKDEELLRADLFIQTSRSEGMSMGILEALSYGVPCLVTRGTNLGEIIEKYDAGWVAETDAQSISCAILRALDERDRWEEKSRNAIKLIEENFQWSKVAESTLKEYQKILD